MSTASVSLAGASKGVACWVWTQVCKPTGAAATHTMLIELSTPATMHSQCACTSVWTAQQQLKRYQGEVWHAVSAAYNTAGNQERRTTLQLLLEYCSILLKAQGVVNSSWLHSGTVHSGVMQSISYQQPASLHKTAVSVALAYQHLQCLIDHGPGCMLLVLRVAAIQIAFMSP